VKILYVTAKGGIHDYRFLKKLMNDYEVLLLHYAADDMIDEIHRLPGVRIISKKPLIKSFPLLTEYRHFKKVYNDFKPDIVHTGYVWQVGILAAMHNVKHHLSMVWGSDILTEPDRSSFKKMLVRKVMQQANHIQCDAEVVKQKIIGDYNTKAEKITVFPWGIDLGIFKPMNRKECRTQLSLPEDRFVIVFNRYLEQVYGIDYLLEGYRMFCMNKEDVLLLLITSGNLRTNVIRFITNHRLEDKVKLISMVPNSELPVFLNASDVYISTSLSDGTSLSLLEAMACGLGLVVTDVPAIKEWVSDKNGILISRRHSGDVCTALETYYNNRSLIEQHGKISISEAGSRADWDKNYLKLREIYKKILTD
jgi:glycosyltransferase involved in cell wall biosynthesis